MPNPSELCDADYLEYSGWIAIFSVMRGPFVEEFYQCVTYAFYTAQWQEQLYTTLSLVLMFLLPLVILITTYIATFRTIATNSKTTFWPEVRRMEKFFDFARQKILRKAKFKSLMITVVIVLTFVVCWTPYYVTMIIFIFLEPDEQLSEGLQSAIYFFGSSTAMLNPLIYGAFHLRPRRKPQSKSTSVINNSSSTRAETSLMTFRKSNPRKSKEENLAQHINGDAFGLNLCPYRQRNTSSTDCERLRKSVPEEITSF
ncbi:gonadotropin-releasing hormone receptor-like [Stegodyphus dumicola]|uniref:gonadotropin-releasing hormone receptor-like n=1 Tax=Stegodyphus dumicola TaxID=202533 RepID=UPI0015AA909C|nr:gonadotropin-releasing hormone receptor-like [Stegodyphus dumicola]